ncbi:phage holin family protein [Pediococcus pentosaceus]|uniref:phage holin family protein n=1 Tax=Pediococcus pentosaceus TaxID=1255 RepID=UPI0021E84538|nr:phage holin family protein [Pediococcus pentosaceus]MCV3330539.1 phage holin family protein [Pediococcus pentosaceus]
MEKLKNINWHDGKLWAGLISLIIVLIQQLMVAFGFTYPVDWQNIIGIVNTVLTILGMLGVISDTTLVNNSRGNDNVESKK